MKCNNQVPKISKKNTLKQNNKEIAPNNNLTKSFFPSASLKVRPCHAINAVTKTKNISIFN